MVKKMFLTLIIHSLLLAIGMYVINVTLYDFIILSLWMYGLVGLLNAILISFLLSYANEDCEQIPHNECSRTSI